MKHKSEAQDYYGTIGLILLVVMVAFDLFFLFLLFIANASYALPIVLPICDVPLIIVMTYYFVVHFHYRRTEYTNIQTVVFTSLEFSYLVRDRAALVGTAVIDGVRTRIHTTYTFTTHVFSKYVASNYMAKELTVGYDPKWKKWVLITE